MSTPGAIAALEIIENDLRARSCPGGIEIIRLSRSPTKQRVTRAFHAMASLVAAGELFVVMFAGHGRPATRPHHAQAWCLTGTEVFTDRDLATALLAFPARVDAVVISDCCYGEGLFRVANSRSRRPAGSPRDAPMVCISGAGETGLVELASLSNLAAEVVAAAGTGQSYRQLSERFAAKARAGRTFHVDARPASRLGDLVLSTSASIRGAEVPGPDHRCAVERPIDSGRLRRRAPVARGVARGARAALPAISPPARQESTAQAPVRVRSR